MKIIKNLLLLQSAFFIYSLSSLFSKMAAQNSSELEKLTIFYIASLVMLGIYALIWQQILKKVPLSVAFSNKGIVVIWGMIWSAIIFKEKISISMLVGATIIIAGIIIMMTGEKKDV